MASVKTILIDQFTACWDENEWFVALKNAIEGMTAEEASWSPAGSDRSVWKLLTHLNYYNNAWLIRFSGGEYVYPEGATNDDTFAVADVLSDDGLKEELRRTEQIMEDWRTALRAADEHRFDEPISPENASLWSQVISDINTHTAYHAGQILLLRKLHGTWDPAKGVS